MLLVISPAKTLDFSTSAIKKHSLPRALNESEELIKLLRKKSADDLKSLMSISDKIAALNLERYQQYETPFTEKNAKQALLAFKGDVYTGLSAEDFGSKDFDFAQKHLRILSGLYGLLRPLDLMQAYRLEMGTKLTNPVGKNLYEFWGTKITELLNADLAEQKSKILINLASKEYFKAITLSSLNAEVYDVNFKEKRNGKYKIISFSAKKARGMMCNFVIKNKIKKPAHLKAFDYDDYVFNESLSSEREFIFTR
ncbi:MAG: peroxide stress protein YaaA [Saprospiraceae bacterium]